MKNIALLVIGLALSARGQQVVGPHGEWQTGWPTALVGPNWATVNATPEQAQAAGWRLATEQEIAARAAADAAAASNEAALASLPATFQTGIAVTNSAGNWVEFVPDGTNVVASTLAVQISQSPLDPATRKAMRDAALATNAATMAQWRLDMQALRDSIATNRVDAKAIAALTNNFTSAQCKQTVNDLRRELIDFSADVKALRKQLARYGKLDDE